METCWLVIGTQVSLIPSTSVDIASFGLFQQLSDVMTDPSNTSEMNETTIEFCIFYVYCKHEMEILIFGSNIFLLYNI